MTTLLEAPAKDILVKYRQDYDILFPSSLSFNDYLHVESSIINDFIASHQDALELAGFERIIDVRIIDVPLQPYHSKLGVIALLQFVYITAEELILFKCI
jgi:hypothetical protein